MLAVLSCVPREDAPLSARLPDQPSPTPTVLLAGDSLFVAHCQKCHGRFALGTDSGPPLLHTIYAPDHHANVAFELAVQNGVRAHHWTFGDMPPVPGVSAAQAVDITNYIRWLQMEAGIHEGGGR
jgi:mono/diheme cytochrome c family protein